MRWGESEGDGLLPSSDYRRRLLLNTVQSSPTTQNVLAPKFNNAEAEKPCLRHSLSLIIILMMSLLKYLNINGTTGLRTVIGFLQLSRCFLSLQWFSFCLLNLP